ncbi:hypothetical protein MUN89_08300 [Halobacillus salinarum]|uniref:Inner spore coat protein n=1 Tax=Halobacillus salinarum TaxID=2932257 RepID=A0ABY4EN74_9BACI|nr:hypothetical protein [Halobacillus salinarum]UOQ45908.1 hypothetical protein MUN89_08300 [Halobacillus salinarum]
MMYVSPLPYYYYLPLYLLNDYGPTRPLPPVDPEFFRQSANESKTLMKQANMVLNQISESKDFSTHLMEAAQRSDFEEVKRLIHSIGVSSDVDIHFTPDSFRLTFKSKIAAKDCCRLTIALRW